MEENITQYEVGERLDKALAGLFTEYSRSAIEKLIEQTAITVNKQSVKPKYRLKENDIIQVNFENLNKQVKEADIPIIYEDDSVMVLNKPAGILTHSKGGFNKEATVASWLKKHLQGDQPTGINPVESSFWDSNRAGIVHRLDRGTSGVMICAKTEEAQRFLQKQFAKRNVKKTYVAVISDTLPEEEGLIDIPLERNPKKPATFRAGVNGKSAQTEFKVLKTTHDQLPTTNESRTHSLIELKPHTGRTHQLRVHLAYLKHPIVGDDFYGGEPAQRLFLHAEQLELTLPNKERKSFSVPVPSVFKRYVA